MAGTIQGQLVYITEENPRNAIAVFDRDTMARSVCIVRNKLNHGMRCIYTHSLHRAQIGIYIYILYTLL